MNPSHAVYMLALEKHAGLGGWLSKGLGWAGKGALGLGINMAGSEVADRLFQKKPEVKQVFVHPGVFQRMQAAKIRGEDPKAILDRFSSANRVGTNRGYSNAPSSGM